MMNSLQSFMKIFRDGELIDRLVLPQEFDVESVLNQRDADDFSAAWMQAFRKVDFQKSACPLPFDVVEKVTTVRKAAYLRAFNRWKSPDLAAYISDDIGLIAEALAT